jgi:hypothetical protein
MVVHSCNPSSQDPEVGESRVQGLGYRVSSKPAWAIYSKTLTHKKDVQSVSFPLDLWKLSPPPF